MTLTHFDHVTIVVTDMAKARDFFALLGFREEQSVVISGKKFERYMRMHGIEAEHVTLAHSTATPRMEVQLLRYRHPDSIPDPHITNLAKLGYNHVCFAVDDIGAEVERLMAHGITPLNEIMDFHSRRLVFLPGPEGITVELSEWHKD